MRNCVNCNKELSKRTKGQLCIQCYRNRNNILDADDIINTDINNEIPKDRLENSSMNASNIIPLFNDNGLNDRAIINLLKQNMLEERMRDTESIGILKSQINFMKAEINNKNEIINKLLIELTDKLEHSSSCNTSRQTNNISNPLSSTLATTETTDNSWSDISSCSLSDTLFNTKDIINKYDRQLANYRYVKNRDFYENKRVIDELLKQNDKQTFDVHNYDDHNQVAAWEMHSTGFASKMLKKMGYGGKGLGKTGEGITHPVSIKGKNKFNSNDNTEEDTIPNHTEKRVANNTHIWPRGTTLIAGSSIISGIEERRLKKYKAKVRAFPGSTVSDMHDYLKPLLKKKPTYLILQIGSNDSPFKTYNEIASEISDLITFINSILPETKVFTSCPVIRLDNKKANSTLRDLDTYLKNSCTDIIVNDNIDSSCLGKRGLHLNLRGSGRLAINYISLMRRL